MVRSLTVSLFNESGGGTPGDRAVDLRRVEGEIHPADGGFLLEAEFEGNQAFQGPGVGPRGMVSACAATLQGVITPGPAGAGLFEIRLASYEHEGEKVNCWLDAYGRTSDVDLPSEGQLEMRWGIALGTTPGMVHTKRPMPTDRVVQVRFDWWTRRGLVVFLGRNLLAGERSHYRRWNPRRKPLDGSLQAPFRDGHFLVLCARFFSHDELRPLGHGYGLGLAHDGQELHWTLDGRVVDTVRVEGFWGSSPNGDVGGLRASIVGMSCYRRNIWRFDSLSLRGG